MKIMKRLLANMTTVRSLLALTVIFSWKQWQLEVMNAFLYEELDKNICMEQPLEFVSREHLDIVCKLKNVFYGLKQVTRAWYRKLAQYKQSCKYATSDSYMGLFINKGEGVHAIVLLYVNDMIITSNNNAEIICL